MVIIMEDNEIWIEFVRKFKPMYPNEKMKDIKGYFAGLAKYKTKVNQIVYTTEFVKEILLKFNFIVGFEIKQRLFSEEVVIYCESDKQEMPEWYKGIRLRYKWNKKMIGYNMNNMADCDCKCNKLNPEEFTKKSKELNEQKQDELYECIKRNFKKQVGNYDYHNNAIWVNTDDCKNLTKFFNTTTIVRFNNDGWSIRNNGYDFNLQPKK